jgi:hypothetical protein
VKVYPNDAAFALVTSVPDGRMIETTTLGSLVDTSKKLPPVVSDSSVKASRVDVEPAGTTALRASNGLS